MVLHTHYHLDDELPQGLDLVENYPNSASISGKTEVELFESQTRQEDYESPALTTELLAPVEFVAPGVGLEPTADGLTVRCSAN